MTREEISVFLLIIKVAINGLGGLVFDSGYLKWNKGVRDDSCHPN